MKEHSSSKCINCNKIWSLEIKASSWNGTKEELKELERIRGRKWNSCLCGVDLYKNIRSSKDIRKLRFEMLVNYIRKGTWKKANA